jgi:plasmid stabilization system protein ParE
MRRYKVRFTLEAERDLLRLYDFLLDVDVDAAVDALAAIRRAIGILEFTPYACRKADTDSPLVRELVIPFGKRGYVVLYEITPPKTVTILAARHQREDDYH